jgi:hypothetical protein
VVTLTGDPDHETKDSYSFTVVASDGVNTDDEQVVSLSVNDLDEVSPTVTANTGSSLSEGGTDVIQTIELAYSDNTMPASSITYTVTSGATYGHVALLANTALPITVFTQAQIDSGDVVYVHDGSSGDVASQTDQFTFSVDDGLGNIVNGQTFELAISQVAEGFDLTSNSVTVDEVTVQAVAVPADILALNGSSTLVLEITGVPSGAILNLGSYDLPSDTWTLGASDDLSTLTVTLGNGFDVEDFSLAMVANTTSVTSNLLTDNNGTAGVNDFAFSNEGTADVADTSGTNFYSARVGNEGNQPNPMIASFSNDVVTTEEGSLSVSFRYNLNERSLDTNDNEEFTLTLEVTNIVTGFTYTLLVDTVNDATGDTGDVDVVNIIIGTGLPAGTYSVKFLGELNNVDSNNERVDMRIDNIEVDFTSVAVSLADTVAISPSSVALDITAVKNDTDETTTQLELQGVPVGVVISDGANTVTSTGAVIDLTGWTLGALTYLPAAGQSGVVTMQLVTTTEEGDGSIKQDSVDVVVGVIPSGGGNLAPVATDDAQMTVLEGGTLDSINVLDNDFDLDGGTLSVTSASSANGLTVIINGDGTLEYVATGSDFNGVDTVTYTITDSQGGSATATFDIVVTPVNDAPTALNSTITAVEDTTYTFSASEFGFSDTADSDDLLNVIIETLPPAAEGTLFFDADGTGGSDSVAIVLPFSISVTDIDAGKFTFEPAANLGGTAAASFTFNVQDDGGAADGGVDTSLAPATLTINIDHVADAVTLNVVSNSLSLALPDSSLDTDSTGAGAGSAIVINTLLTDPALDLSSTIDSTEWDGAIAANANTEFVTSFDGQFSLSTVYLSPGDSLTYNWEFITGENLTNEIEEDFNDHVMVVIYNSLGAIVSVSHVVDSETTLDDFNSGGAAFDNGNGYTWSNQQVDVTLPGGNPAGEYKIGWFVMNGGDGAKDSTFNVSLDGPTGPDLVELEDRNAVLSIVIGTSDDKDGSETVSITIGNVVNGVLNNGTDNGDNTWTLTQGQLSGLAFIPDASFSGTQALEVFATSTDVSGAPFITATETINVSVESPISYILGDVNDNNPLDGTGLSDLIYGDAGNDEINAGDGNDLIHGSTGVDIIRGDGGDDRIYGGDGDDFIYGGTGNDALTGGVGADTFVWELNDQGTVASPAIDNITDVFVTGVGGDVLDLSELLIDEENNSLENYLHFELADGDTVIHIDQNGDVDNQETQQIVLTGVDLVSGFTDDAAIIASLTANNLIVDT